MLYVTIPESEYFDEQKEEFVKIKKQTLQLEHSLVSISKWEAKWCKSFMDEPDKTFEESIDYVRCMTLTQNVDPALYYTIPKKVFDEITEYIASPMSATTFTDRGRRKPAKKEKITSELIYYWMAAQQIPFECQKWHLNRLFNLIKIFDVKSNPGKKMSKREILEHNRALNEARKKQFNTTG